MSHARDIAQRVATPQEAAAAIRATIAAVAPDLIEPSDKWKTQAQLLAGAVGVVMADLGKAVNSVAFADATCDVLACGRPQFD